MNRMESNPATRSLVFGIRSIEDATATNLEPISLDLEMNNLAGCENGWLSRKRLGAMSQMLQIGKRKACPVCLERKIESGLGRLSLDRSLRTVIFHDREL